MASDRLRRLDPEDVQDSRHEIDRVVILAPNLASCLRADRPRDDARVGGAAVELVALPHLERRVEGHGPAVRVVVVGLRPTEIVEHREVCGDVVRDPVHELHLDDESVVALPRRLEVIEQTPDLIIGVGEEARVHLRHVGEQPLLVVGERVPGARDVERRERLALGPRPRLVRPQGVDRRQLRFLGNDAHLLLARERLLPHRLVAHVELALVLLDPLRRCMVRCVAGTRCVVEEERLVGRNRFRVHDELDRLVRDVHAEVVALFRRRRLVDRMVVVGQLRVPLARLRAEESVEPLEATTRGPVPARRGEVHLNRRAEVPFADDVRVPAGLAEDLGEHPVLGWDRAARVREPARALGDARHAVTGVIATGQQARTRRGAERRRVPLRVTHAVCCDLVDVRGRDRSAVTAHRREADVVEHDVDDARGSVRSLRRHKRRPILGGVPDVDLDMACKWRAQLEIPSISVDPT